MEQWKDIPGYEGLYAVSSLGRIKSLDKITYKTLDKTKVHRRLKSKFIYCELTNKGYFRVRLSKNGEEKAFLLHKLILLTFIGPSDFWCNHINLIKTDNRLINLEYVTTKYNFEHALINGACSSNHGENKNESKISNKDRIFIIENKGILKSSDLAKMFNISVDLVRYYWKKRQIYIESLHKNFK